MNARSALASKAEYAHRVATVRTERNKHAMEVAVTAMCAIIGLIYLAIYLLYRPPRHT